MAWRWIRSQLPAAPGRPDKHGTFLFSRSALYLLAGQGQYGLAGAPFPHAASPAFVFRSFRRSWRRPASPLRQNATPLCHFANLVAWSIVSTPRQFGGPLRTLSKTSKLGSVENAYWLDHQNKACVQVPISDNSEQLSRELEHCIRAKDDEGVRRLYRHLLQVGRSRQEVIGDLIKVTAAKPDAARTTFSGADSIQAAPLRGEVETNTAEHAQHLLYRAGTVLQSRTNLHPPIPGPAVRKGADNLLTNAGPNVNRRDGHLLALRRTVLHPLFFGIAAVALVSVGGLLLQQPPEQKHSAATAFITTSTTQQRSTSERAETGEQGPTENEELSYIDWRS